MYWTWTRVLLSVTVLFVVSATESTTTVTQSLTTSPSTPVTTHTSQTSHILSSSHFSKSSDVTPVPTNTPTIPTNSSTRNSYVLLSFDSRQTEREVCLMMDSDITLTFRYDTKDNKESTITVPIGPAAAINYDGSTCTLSTCAEPTSAILMVDYNGYSISMTFNETEDNNHYVSSSITVGYVVNEKDFPDLKDPTLIGRSIKASSKQSLFDWTAQTITLLSSYHCVADTTLNKFNNSMTDGTIRVSVSFSNLQVQAFKFDNNGTSFDDDHNCYADRKIIVPIAVAAALTILATGVLVASLVKLCWRKHKERSEHSKKLKYNRLSSNTSY